ncbi:MAG: class I SAM-dependent methyltransferase [Candidatus Polarisedimenticolaceae bacterium]|nr:class I SAM-dependent methyltransferase [Candidatus Polarisedimenticolaceae bacterium]
MKLYAESCEQNREPILEVLQTYLSDRQKVLEIGSGTGQHAIYFASHLPHLVWLTSDLPASHAGINAWLDEAALSNVNRPLALDVTKTEWPSVDVDAVFSANTAHIISWSAVEKMFSGVGRLLKAGGIFCLYGPFNYGGEYTSDSNAQFDVWLKSRDPNSAIRDFEALNRLAIDHGMSLENDHVMPANNRFLAWCKQ